jgi:DNA-binding NarL/FixJ family response regulator
MLFGGEMMIRVMIAEDHKIVREGIVSLISREPEIEVIGEAENGVTAIDMARELEPDVIVMDISMPELNGIEAMVRIREYLPEGRIFALSMHEDRRFVLEALKSGANGYMLKDCAAEDLVLGIKAIAGGETFFSPRVAAMLANDYVKRINEPGSPLDSISGREREVLKLIAEGLNTKAIAYKLDISIKTVETHRTHIMKKLHIFNVAELTKLAIKEGLVSLN